MHASQQTRLFVLSVIRVSVQAGMSKEAGELYAGDAADGHRASIGFSTAPPSTQSDTTVNLPDEASALRVGGDSAAPAATHRHQEAKENITLALNPAYGYVKVLWHAHLARSSLGLSRWQLCVASAVCCS